VKEYIVTTRYLREEISRKGENSSERSSIALEKKEKSGVVLLGKSGDQTMKMGRRTYTETYLNDSNKIIALSFQRLKRRGYKTQ